MVSPFDTVKCMLLDYVDAIVIQTQTSDLEFTKDFLLEKGFLIYFGLTLLKPVKASFLRT